MIILFIVIFYSVSALACLDLWKTWKKLIASECDIMQELRHWTVGLIVFVPVLNAYFGFFWWKCLLEDGRQKAEAELHEALKQPIK